MVQISYSSKFACSENQLADQYYHIYNVRLKCTRESLMKSAHFRWGEEVKNVPLEQLNASLASTNVFVIGTLFKSMPKQRSILKELEGDELPVEDSEVNFTSEEDSLILHETDENVQLVGDIDIHSHVTGIPVALLGHQLNGGAKFHVEDVCYAGPNLDVYRELNTNGSSRKIHGDSIVFVSGLEFSLDASIPVEKITALKKLRSFILGKTEECDNINGHSNSKVVKVIIAGNSIAQGYTKDIKALNSVLKIFDRYVFELAQGGAEITILPGKNDPSSFLIPQQPFHPKVLPLSGSLKNVHPTTNPCSMQIDKYKFLGTSGENVEAIKQHSRIEFSTTILKNTLEWGHIAPSAPDNLSCLPFKDRDPLVMDFVPDVYFAGNQPEFGVTTYSSKSKSKIQLISVPSFSKTMTCVIVNLSNLDCEQVNL